MAELCKKYAKEKSPLRSKMCDEQVELSSGANIEYDGIETRLMKHATKRQNKLHEMKRDTAENELSKKMWVCVLLRYV